MNVLLNVNVKNLPLTPKDERIDTSIAAEPVRTMKLVH
jgi:hypothetical protein